MKKWTACENHGWYVEGVAPNGGAIVVSAFGITENEARLIASAPRLQEQVRILREALEEIRNGSRPTGRWMDNFGCAVESEGNDGTDPDRMPEMEDGLDPDIIFTWEPYDEEEQRLWLDSVASTCERALEATKEGA